MRTGLKPLIYLSFLIFQVGACGFCNFALAREDLMPGSRYTSGAGAAMGDAYLPIGDDVGTALFYNPANFGRFRGFQVQPVNFSLYVNGPFMDYVTSGSTGITNLSNYLQKLQAKPDQWQGAGYSYMASFGFPGLGIGLLYQSEFAGRSNSADGTVSYRSNYQLIPAIGTGLRLFNGLFRFGVSMQWVNKAAGSGTVPSSSSVAYNDNIAQGSGFSTTVGTAVILPIEFLPTFNFVVRNALGTTYGGTSLMSFANNSSGAPPTEPMTYDLSFSVSPKLDNGGNLQLVAVARDMMNVTGVDYMGHMAFGGEFNFRQRLFLRAGFGSGYPAAGLGFKRQGAELSLSWYSEEVGSHYQDQRDVRFLLQYTLRNF